MRLFRFPQSCYARFVQAALDLARVPHEVVDVPFGDREELARLTGGYIQVPVVVRGDGSVLTDSRRIVATLASEDPRVGALLPDAEAGPIWAYVDFMQTTFEEVCFKIPAPVFARKHPTAFERALYVFVKERKYGAGCVDAWERDAEPLFARLLEMLEPTARTLGARGFVVAPEPTLADAALYGQIAMLEHGAPDRVAALPAALLAWKTRLEALMGPPPHGPIARAHRSTGDIERAHDAASSRSRSGRVERIVLRTATNERATPEEGALDPDRGLAGDAWAAGKRRPGMQISIMDLRVAAAIADEADWHLAGDNLIVDHDLAALTEGDRLRAGSAVLEITGDPHLGCRKFASRYGYAALAWVNDKARRADRRRGIYARVVEAGVVRVGDVLVRIARRTQAL